MNESEINRFLSVSRDNFGQYKLAFISLDCEQFDGIATASRFKRENMQIEICGMANEQDRSLDKKIREAKIDNLIQRPFSLQKIVDQIDRVINSFWLETVTSEPFFVFCLIENNTYLSFLYFDNKVI